MRPVADMNIDGPEETQEALVLEDFGIVVDYGELGEDEKEVSWNSHLAVHKYSPLTWCLTNLCYPGRGARSRTSTRRKG